MSRTMSLKETTALVPSGPPPLFSKFKTRAKDVESPKSVISDPRIVSPASSASASLERRLTDLKKVPRHDRVHSISDADDENALPDRVNLSAVLLSRQLSNKASNGHLLLESVSEAHSLPSAASRVGQISSPSSETSSPRNRMSRNAGKDGAKNYVRGSDNEFVNRRTSMGGADTTTSSVLAPLPHPTDLQVEGEYTQSFISSPPKSSNRGESDRTRRKAAGFMDPRPISSKTLARKPVQGTRLSGKEDSLPLEGKDAAVGSMYNLLMNGFNGPNLEETVSGRGTSRSGESTSRNSSPVKSDSELPYEDLIELNKFVVDSGGEEIKHKVAWSPGSTTTRDHRNSFSGDGRSSAASGYRQQKISKTSSSPSESPGHPIGFNELAPRSALIELSSDFVIKATSQGVKDFPGIVQKDTRTYNLKSTSHGDHFDKTSSTRSADGWKKSVDSHTGSAVPSSILPADGPPSLHALPSLQGMAGVPDSHNVGDKSFQHGGKVPGAGETSKVSLIPQQRFVPGQFLKSNPLKPRPQPAKWDDAEKWLVNPASIKSNAQCHSQYGNGHLSSGGSTPQHISQFHAAVSVRQHHLPSSNQSSRMLNFGTSTESMPTANSEAYDARLLSANGDLSANAFPPTTVVHYQRSYDSSTATTDRHDETIPVDVKVAEISNRDETGTRPEGMDHPHSESGAEL